MNLEEAIHLAIERTEAGFFAEAEAIYDQILLEFPGHKVVGYLRSQVQGAIEAEQLGSAPEKHLLDAYKKYPCHYQAVPSYNVNWAIRDTTPLDSFLSRHPITLVDIGARDAFLGEVENLKKYCAYIGFDADVEECDRANAQPPEGFAKFKMLPYYLGRSDGEQVDFNLYLSRGDSSRFGPGERFKKLFKQGLQIERTVSLEATKLDTAVAVQGISGIDLLKLDTQGSELEILQSGLTCLQDVLLVESEIEMTEMYRGQPLLGEFLVFMREQGFELLYLNRVFQGRQHYGGECRGQLIFGDALFAKSETHYARFSPESLAKHAVLLVNYGHLDIAHDIWNGHAAVKALLPGLAGYFKAYQENGPRLRVMGRDKLLSWQLHQRRTNQFQYESDRSWPIR